MCKFKESIFVVLVLLGTLVLNTSGHRSRRFLTFPPTAPTRVQVHLSIEHTRNGNDWQNRYNL